MDYKEKYNAALERAKAFELPEYKNIMASVFPELKESEDDQIRKTLIDYFQAYKEQKECGITTFYGISTDNILAWLEKQGKEEYALKSFRDKDVHKFMQYIENEAKAYEFNLPNRSYDIYAFAKDILYWLEKQSEQKPYGQRKECSDCQFNYAGECKGFCQVKRDEQKAADKVEPKFHEGEWLCENEPNNYARFIQILEIVNVQGKERYRISRDIHNDEDIVEFGFIEKYYHKFTIQDAKDGDLIYVSTEEKGIQAIFHEYKNDTIFFHCYLCADFVQGGYTPIGSVELTYPLQKTHYNRFFEKMHEAGYEWDAETKELKETEPKTLDAAKVIEWLNDQACQGWIEDVEVDKFIAKFKKDFGL